MNEGKKGYKEIKHAATPKQPAPKPRNFVAKNAAATTSGAGAHKDKKKAAKQGETKHKKTADAMAENIEYAAKLGLLLKVAVLKDRISEAKVKEVAGPEKCWPGHRKVGTKPGTGKNAGKRVNDCEKIGEGKEDKIAQLKKDHETAVHWSKNEKSPQKREAARQKAEKIKRHLDTQYKQGVAEGFNGEYDDEAGMAQSNLHTIARAAQGLLDTIGDKENLPEWAQEKIAKVEGMLVTVWDYLLSQEELGIDPQQDMSESSLDEACWKNYKQIGMKKKGGRQVPNCVPKESVKEARMSAAAKLSKAWDRQQEKSAASRKRGQELLNPPKPEEKKKEEVKEHKKGVRAVKHTKKSVGLEPMKPRNFVAKNALGGGAGAHKDKKKSAKQGDHKHKSKVVDIGESWELEMSNAVGMLLEAVDPKVLQLQKDLIAKGAKIQADGIMGPKTQAAMKQFGGQQAVPGGWTDGSGNPIRSSDGAPVASGSTPKPSKDKPIAGVVKGGAGFTDVKTADGEVQRREGVRNWRNNNPGNIRKGKYAISKGAIGDDGAFAVFPTLDAGLKAKEDLVFGPTYINLSIRDAIARYAPPSENNTNMYIQRVVDATGASSDTVLSTLNSAQRNNMLSAINKMEGFKVGSITSLGNATA
jgi:peptidoglycan hydrolase-like protein with peptidoglycan-binding domain